MYNYDWSYRVVKRFLEQHERGWAFLEKYYERVTFDNVVAMFRHNQKAWNVMKTTVKMADRLTTSQMYSGSHELIMLNVAHLREVLVDRVKKGFHDYEAGFQQASTLPDIVPSHVVENDSQLSLFPDQD